MYFKGGSGIVAPVDFNGTPIKEGDILTHCWFENDYTSFFERHTNIHTPQEIEKEVHKPSVVVRFDKEKCIFYGEGITQKLYMHDFRFKCAKIV